MSYRYSGILDLRELADEAKTLWEETMSGCGDCSSDGTVEKECPTCGGEGVIVHPPSANDIRVGESRRLHEKCPDCDDAGIQEVECEACGGEGETRSLDHCTDPDELLSLMELASEVCNVAFDKDTTPLDEWDSLIDDFKDTAENEGTAIPDYEFADYAEQLAEDLGYMTDDSARRWPFNCIDWERAADELKMDYTSFDWKGTSYYIRSY